MALNDGGRSFNATGSLHHSLNICWHTQQTENYLPFLLKKTRGIQFDKISTQNNIAFAMKYPLRPKTEVNDRFLEYVSSINYFTSELSRTLDLYIESIKHNMLVFKHKYVEQCIEPYSVKLES